MNILPILPESKIDKSETEQVQKQKHEYHFLGSFLRTAGLSLFAYDSLNNKMYPLNIKYSDTINIVIQDGQMIPVDMEAAKCMIDSRHIIFEALNHKTTEHRLTRFKQGKNKRTV
jgi:hypothetical protein